MKHSTPTDQRNPRLSSDFSPSKRWTRVLKGLVFTGLVTGGLVACGGSGGGGSTASKGSNNPPGAIVDKPGGGFFIADPNQNGNAQEPRIVRTMFGRMVEVFGLDSLGVRVPMSSRFVISTGLISDGQSYLLETNPVTAQQVLVILRDVTDEVTGGGRSQFFTLLKEAEQNLTPIIPTDADGAGLYSMVPRNSTVVVQFTDLMDAESLGKSTFRIRTGNPPVVPFEGRVFMDPNHGDVSEHDGQSGLEYYSTRVMFDPTVTVIESFESDPPLPINGVGLPASSTVELANFEVRIPTLLNPSSGQIKLLRNPSGHAVTSKNNGPVDFSGGKADVVRAARSGGPENVTADPFNGFMPDGEAPRVVGSTPTVIAAQPVSLNGYDEFVLPLVVFTSEFCSQTPHPGDVLVQPGIFAEVTQTPAPVQNGQVLNVPVRLLLWPTVWDSNGLNGPLEWLTNAAGDASFLSAFNPIDDLDHQSCFVQVTPTPSGFPANPTDGLFTSSAMTLLFSEPMDPASLTAFDSMTLTRLPIPPEDDPALATSDFVVGSLNQALSLQEFTFLPDLPLAHKESEIESYYLTLTTGKFAPTDLAGNPVGLALPPVVLNIDPTAAPQFNGGRVSRFTNQDEEEPFGDPESGPLPEWSGQHLYDLKREVIRPRPVVHFQIPADRSQAVPAMMTPFAQGVQTPLSSLGSKMQTLWRYVDFGFSLSDVTNYNIDVEGVYWAPIGGAVVSDSYEEFQISIGHCRFAPDEYIDPGSLFPKWANSGLKDAFVNNFLNLNSEPAKIVHERFRGYHVNPGDLIVSPSSGTKLMPYPWNRNVSPDDWKTWTWRNTELRDRAGKNSGGVDPWILFAALGGSPPDNFYMRQNFIRTIGLPMLMEFRCYPDDGAVGANSFDISLAANSSSRPYFRAFSTGGINQSGNPVTIDPDIENKANGGFNPGSSPPGKPTHGLDNTFYIGAADFVVRLSRSHSVWFPATNPFSETKEPFNNPAYSPPVLEPKSVDQPDGTAVILAFRGMNKFNPTDDACGGTANNFEPLENALTLDNYGDHYDDKCLAPTAGPNHNPNNENLGINFLSNDKWKKSIQAINTAKYYQVRITFQADIFTGLVPEVSALAISWVQ